MTRPHPDAEGPAALLSPSPRAALRLEPSSPTSSPPRSTLSDEQFTGRVLEGLRMAILGMAMYQRAREPGQADGRAAPEGNVAAHEADAPALTALAHWGLDAAARRARLHHAPSGNRGGPGQRDGQQGSGGLGALALGGDRTAPRARPDRDGKRRPLERGRRDRDRLSLAAATVETTTQLEVSTEFP